MLGSTFCHHCAMCQYVECRLLILLLLPLVECWCMHMATSPGQGKWSGPYQRRWEKNEFKFHRVTCYTNSIVSRIHVNATKLHNIMCTWLPQVWYYGVESVVPNMIAKNPSASGTPLNPWLPSIQRYTRPIPGERNTNIDMNMSMFMAGYVQPDQVSGRGFFHSSHRKYETTWVGGRRITV